MAATTKKQSLLSRLYHGLKPSDQEGLNELPENGSYDDPSGLRDILKDDDDNSGAETNTLITPFPSNRAEGYVTFDRMALDPTIDSALKMHVANALSAKTDTGEIIFIQSAKDTDDKIVADLRNTVGKWLNEYTESIAYQTAKYGINYVRPYMEQGKGIVHIRYDHYTHPAYIKQYERAGLPCGFTSKYQRVLEREGIIKLMVPWRYVAFKIPKWGDHGNNYVEPLRINPLAFDIDDDDFMNEEPIESQDYGSSLIRTAHDPWTDLNEATLALNQSRQNAAKRDRFITIQTGNKNPSLAAKYYNTIMTQLKRKLHLSSRRSALRGHISTIDNHVLPVPADGSGSVNIQTEQSEVNISAIEDVNFHVNRLCSALGADKSLLGFTDDMSGGLGEGGWWTQSMIAAIKANQIRRAVKMGAERLCELHVLMKWGKVYTETDKPWRLEFNSLNNVLEREEATARDSRAMFATSVLTMMQMLDPEMNKFDFNKTANWLFTDVMRVNEDTFKGLIKAVDGGNTNEINEVLDSAISGISDVSDKNELKSIIYGCIAELMETPDE
ncbi:portal protein [Vibrio sp.]|uniref:portal protein n=1 Tax=Vibrio sp. TaxID=678 RepID=UPI00378CBC64